VVHPLVVAADDEQMALAGKFAGHRLPERLSLRSHEHDLGVRAAQFLDGGEDRFGFEQHPLAAAAEVVVGAPVLVGGPVAELVGVDFDDPRIPRAPDDTLVQRGEGDVREESENVDFHGGGGVRASWPGCGGNGRAKFMRIVPVALAFGDDLELVEKAYGLNSIGVKLAPEHLLIFRAPAFVVPPSGGFGRLGE